ncbi:hypothetical protein TGCAST_309830 [Toxoplasma gondii CAST]|uniref:Uncharacterized protein n=1 Tax=Toxoplasma gondii CAST TaxID=943122 RepID=A0A3R8B6N5_TOXGO|nr:hypothetical protein TGCAST_309830 [Toxoplasma gondii CAST]
MNGTSRTDVGVVIYKSFRQMLFAVAHLQSREPVEGEEYPVTSHFEEVSIYPKGSDETLTVASETQATKVQFQTSNTSFSQSTGI